MSHTSHVSHKADSVIQLGEVAVTAIKGGCDPTAAEAVTTIDRREVERLDIVNLRDASAIAPNVFMPRYGSRLTSTAYVRGLGSPRLDQPVAGMMVDNIPLMNKDNFDTDLADIDNIEILRGPQNTLYGRNTMGGLMNVYTLSPLSYQGVRVAALYGNHNRYRASAGVYCRPTSDFGVALTGQADGTDGFYRNQFDHSQTGRERNYGLRLKAAWRPKDNVMVENTALFSSARQKGYPYADCLTNQINYDDTCRYRRLSFTDGLTVKHNLPGVAFSALLSFQYMADTLALDQDFHPDKIFNMMQKRHEWGLTADFVARSTREGVYHWLAGAYGFSRRTFMDAPVTFLDDGIRTLIEDRMNSVSDKMHMQWDSRSLLLGTNFSLPSWGWSLYHESELHLGAFTATAALRFDWEHTAMTYRGNVNSGFTLLANTPMGWMPAKQIPIDIADQGRLAHTYTQFLPKFSLAYALPGSLGSVYAAVAEGYKSGGYNVEMYSNILQEQLMSMMGAQPQWSADEVMSYRPEKDWTYEVGTHLSFLDGRLSADATLFWIEVDDQQVAVFPEGTASGRMMANAARSRSRGVEVSASYAAPCGLTLRASYGLADARFRRFNDGKQDYKGRQTPYAPRNTLFGSAFWTGEFPGSFIDRLTVGASARCAGKIYFDEANTVAQPFYAVADASLRAYHGAWSLELWADNFTDTRYTAYYFVTLGNRFFQRSDGASFGATLRWNFAF